METRRFDELTVALARGDHDECAAKPGRGVVGALASNRASLAKNDKSKTPRPHRCGSNNLGSPDCRLRRAKTDNPLQQRLQRGKSSLRAGGYG
jgi:hypothetical protein